MTTQSVIQGKYILGSKSVVGDPGRKWEDRVYIGELNRPSNSALIVGIVADGVGSAELGARGAQLAIDTVISSLRSSQGDDIPALIDTAIETANSAVFRENQKNDGDGLSTLVVAVIFNDRCYVGNVGDSRAYWIQIGNQNKPGRVLQLTRDHTYYNIYGGDKRNPEAGYIVNAIGKKGTVKVDCGFYLKKSESENYDLDKAYQLGLAGLPLKPGDAIMLCSDGLIKDSPVGEPYTKPEEILDAVQNEYLPDRAAIKMVSRAEGRRPDDNVSAVTIQYLSRELVQEMKTRSENSKKVQIGLRIGLGVIGVLAFAIISLLSFRVVQMNNLPTPTERLITSTPMPTATATQPIPAGKARVEQVNGGLASVKVGDYLDPGVEIFTNNAGVRIIVGEQTGKAGVMYWFDGNSAGTVDFNAMMMKPTLKNGAVYIEPAKGGSAEVHIMQTDLVATVSGSRMIVELKQNEIFVYCFEGTCLLGKNIPVGSKISYNTVTNQWNPSNGATKMTYDEEWAWNVRCNYCMGGVVPSPTPTPTAIKENIDVNPGGTPAK